MLKSTRARMDPWGTPFFRHLLLLVTPPEVERTKHLFVTISMITFTISRSFRVRSSFSFRPWCQTECEESKVAVQKMVAEGVQPGQASINSNDFSIHYSVDYMRNIMLPSFAQHPSRLYFYCVFTDSKPESLVWYT